MRFTLYLENLQMYLGFLKCNPKMAQTFRASSAPRSLAIDSLPPPTTTSDRALTTASLPSLQGCMVGEEKKIDLDQVDDPSSQSKEDLHLYIVVIFAFWDSVQESTYFLLELIWAASQIICCSSSSEKHLYMSLMTKANLVHPSIVSACVRTQLYNFCLSLNFLYVWM